MVDPAMLSAIAALIGGKLDATWARWSRPWTTVAWMFLTCGIALGSFWAYYELGWGGWWFWDPVENASFMPWLVGTALIHSLAVTEKRGGFKSWTVLLAITAFSLSLLGTFYCSEFNFSSRLLPIQSAAFSFSRFVFVIGGSLLLYAWPREAGRTRWKVRCDLARVAVAIKQCFVNCRRRIRSSRKLYPLIVDALGMAKQQAHLTNRFSFRSWHPRRS
jgi:cytochrome c-type biogenesis protein CcmF